MFDITNMMGKLKDAEKRIKEMQEKLADVQAHGESGGGLVKVTVNGKKQMTALHIDPSLMNNNDKKMTEDLVVAAVNKALEAIQSITKEELKKHTGGLIPNIPGIDLSNLIG